MTVPRTLPPRRAKSQGKSSVGDARGGVRYPFWQRAASSFGGCRGASSVAAAPGLRRGRRARRPGGSRRRRSRGFRSSIRCDRSESSECTGSWRRRGGAGSWQTPPGLAAGGGLGLWEIGGEGIDGVGRSSPNTDGLADGGHIDDGIVGCQRTADSADAEFAGDVDFGGRRGWRVESAPAMRRGLHIGRKPSDLAGDRECRGFSNSGLVPSSAMLKGDRRFRGNHRTRGSRFWKCRRGFRRHRGG